MANQATDLMGIDIHHHIFAQQYLDELKGTPNLLPNMFFITPQQALDDMDQGGVAMSVTSITQPGIWFGDNEQARRFARIHNEYGAQLVRDYPGRFGLFAALPLPDIDGSLREIEYSLDVLKADGVCLMTSYHDKWPGDPLFEPVFQELDRRGVVVYTHPIAPTCCRGLVPGIADGIIEWQTDTTRAIARVLFTGQAAKYPNVRYIWSHGGGTAPYLWERFKNLGATDSMKQHFPNGILYEMQRMYYDTAQMHNPVAMASLRALIPTSRIVLGSDFPYRRIPEYAERLPECGFTAEEMRMIFRENILELMPHLRERLAPAR